MALPTGPRTPPSRRNSTALNGRQAVKAECWPAGWALHDRCYVGWLVAWLSHRGLRIILPGMWALHGGARVVLPRCSGCQGLRALKRNRPHVEGVGCELSPGV